MLDRVNIAKDTTDGALQLINSNTKELDNALNTLKGKLTIVFSFYCRLPVGIS